MIVSAAVLIKPQTGRVVPSISFHNNTLVHTLVQGGAPEGLGKGPILHKLQVVLSRVELCANFTLTVRRTGNDVCAGGFVLGFTLKWLICFMKNSSFRIKKKYLDV